MRPLQLQITGLNSFRKATPIDFEPLLKDGLFGIFGPTGSGKSTILDAITLALYGKVRRAPGGTSGIINMGESRCSVSFSFAIGGNGSRKHYTVERLFARNKGGGIETKKVRLLDHSDGIPKPIGEKTNELKERINDIIGISIEDFLRAVVLPQGAFAEFLSLETRERSAVLQRLFGLYDLGDRLNTILKQRAQELESARAELEGRLQELRAYDDAAVVAAEEALKAAEEHRTAMHEEYLRVETRHTEAAALHALIVEYRQLTSDTEKRRMQEESLTELRSRIELAERAAFAAPGIAALASAQIRFTDADARYNEAVRENARLEKNVVTARESLDKAKAAYPLHHDHLCDEISELTRIREAKEELNEKRKRRDGMMRELETFIESHGTVSRRREEGVRSVQSMEREIAEIEREIDGGNVSAEERLLLSELMMMVERRKGLHDEMERIRGEADRIAKEIAVLSETLRTGRNEEEAKGSDLDRVKSELAAARDRLARVREEREQLLTRHAPLKDAVSGTGVLIGELEKNEIEIRSQKEKVEGGRRMLAEVQRRLQEAQSLENAVCHERNAVAVLREESYRRHALASLTEHLQDGVPCPLCGSIEHLSPYHPEHSVVGDLEAHDGELTRLEKKLREAEERTRDIERSIVQTETGLEGMELTIDNLGKEIAAKKEKITGLLKDIDSERPIATVEELRARLQEITMRGQETRRLQDELESGIREIEERMNRAERERNGAVERRARLEAELAAKEQRHRELLEKSNELQNRYQAEESLFRDRSGGRSVDLVEAALRDITRHDRAVEEMRGKIVLKRDQLQTAKQLLAQTDTELQAIATRKSGAEGTLRELESEIDRVSVELRSRIDALVPEAERREEVERLIERRERERDRIRREHDDAKQRYDEIMVASKVARERVDHSWNERCREEKTRDEADRACHVVLAEHRFTTIAEAKGGMLTSEELRRCRVEAQEIAEAIDRARHRIEELRGKIGGREIGEEEIATLGAELERAKGANEDALKQLGGAQKNLDECREKNAEWRRVCQQDLVGTEERATAEQLSKYLRGNGFVDFLANERLNEICRRASIQLDVLTRGRFAIESQQRVGFIIRDNGNGGGERSPSSLSGGETFLVSLSLALALSDTIQLGHAPLEFFFLDEGFGTLDSDLLDTVMNTLERLRSEHRAIGVISHVSQLRERIMRRLIVTPASESEGSTVRFEVA